MTPSVPPPVGAPGEPAAVLPPPALQAVERILSDVDGAATTVVVAAALAERDHVVRVVAASGTQAVVKRARTGTPGRAWADACAAAPGAAAFPALGRLAADLGARLRQLWPDVVVPA